MEHNHRETKNIKCFFLLKTNSAINKGFLSHIFGAEKALGTTQDRILVRIVGMILGRDFKDSRNWRRVTVDRVTNHLCNLLENLKKLLKNNHHQSLV